MSDTEKSKGGRPKKGSEYYLQLIHVPVSGDSPGADYLLQLGSKMLTDASKDGGWKIEKLLFVGGTMQLAVGAGEGSDGVIGQVRPVLILWRK